MLRTEFHKHTSPIRLGLLLSVLFLLLVMATDPALDPVQAAPVTVNCSGTSGAPTSVDEASLASDDVTFSDTGGDGYCELDNSISAASVVIESGVVLTHVAEDTDGVTITTTGNFQIDATGAINADAKGCPQSDNTSQQDGYYPNGSNVCIEETAYAGDNGAGEEASDGQGGGGGAHGGLGMDGNGASREGGTTYDSATNPVLFGASGGGTTSGGRSGEGGGLVLLNIGGIFTHNGTISADGGNGTVGTTSRVGGGGAGGSINITSGNINGSGTFSADGGNGASSTAVGGGGAGGRIAINHTGGSFSFDSSDFTVDGGTGSVAVANENNGTVYVNNTATNSVNIYHGFTFDNTDHSVTNWVFDSSADNVYCSDAAISPSITATGTLTLDGEIFCGNFDSGTNNDGRDADSLTSFTFDNNPGGDFNVAANMTIEVNNAEVVGDGADITFDIAAGDTQSWSGVTITGSEEGFFTIDDAIAMTLTGNSAINANAQWTNLASLDIDSGSSIAANAIGCRRSDNTSQQDGYFPNGSNVCTEVTSYNGSSGAGEEASDGQGGGGGGHGGLGMDGNGSSREGGTTYGSATAPVLFGASGGGTTSGGRSGQGGGYIRLDVTGAFEHDGSITVNGGDGIVGTASRTGGGGAGGSIYITTTTLSGTSGSFSANGGNGADGASSDGGGGAGGRIAITCTGGAQCPGGASPFASGDFTVTGGTGSVATADENKGTVYVKNTATDTVNIFHGFTFDDTDHSVTNWIVDSGATNQYCSDAAISPSVTATGTLTIGGDIFCGNFDSGTNNDGRDADSLTSFTLDNNPGGDFNILASTDITINNNDFAGTIGNTIFDIAAGDTQSWSGLTFTGSEEGNFTIDDAVAITLTGNSTITSNVTWSNLSSLQIDSGSSINVDQYGCRGSDNANAQDGYGPDANNVCTEDGTGAGQDAANGSGGGGGAHGGAGGNGNGGKLGGSAYDSTTMPARFGASGGGTDLGAISGKAGGLISLQITGTFTHNGTLTADGGSGSTNGSNKTGGGSAGGGIYVSASTITCVTGTFDADGGDGGDGSSSDGGGGGGGIISLIYVTDNSSGGCALDSGADTIGGSGASVLTAGGAGPDTATDGGDGSVNIQASSPTTLNCTGSAGSPTAVTESTVNNDSPLSLVTFEGGGYCELDESLSVGSVLIQNNTTVTHDSEDVDGVTITTTGTFQIDSGSSINVDEKGCASVTSSTAGRGPNGSNVCSVSGTGSGGDPSSVQGGGGGGHGGVGGNGSGSAAGGITHDSATAPVSFGASGGGGFGGAASGAGGGLVRLNIGGTLTHNGTISSDGGNGLVGGGFYGTGGGSGGSIYITAGNINGTTGAFSAAGGNGGNGTSADGGGGGSGRIAITHTGGSFSFDSSDFTMTAGTGGSDAGQGNSAAGEVGTVYVQNTNTSRVDIFHGFTFDDTDHSVTTWVSDTGATNQYCNTTGGNTPSVTATDITFGGTLDCTTTQDSFNWTASNSFTFSNNASLTVVGDMTIDPATTLTMGTGVTVGVTGVDNDLEFDVPNTPQSWSGLTVNGAIEGDFTIDDAITLTLTGNSAINANAQWTNLSSLTIDSGSSISANAKGCNSATSSVAGSGPNGSNVCSVGGTGSGGDPSSIQGGGGGGHGGVGGNGSGSAAGGVTYDSPTAPVLFGASGGGGFASAASGAGGGFVRLNISGTLTHNGTVSADGGNGLVDSGFYGTGGGAGGSIYITTGTLNGTSGTFSADGGNGGDGTSADGGGGGGGRIAITYATSTFSLDSSDFTVTTGSGGSGVGQGNSVAGEVGTVYTKDTTNSRVDIYHGFTYDDTDYSETTWVIDPSADNQYCSTSAGNTPSITATNFTFDGTLNCTTALDSFNFASTSDFNVGSGASFTITETNADFDWDIADGDDQTWTNVTITGPNEGDFTINDEIDITLSGTTAINANVQWTELTNLTIESGTSILADGKGCRSVSTSGDDGYGPNGSNICSETGQGAGLDRSSINGGGGAGHGGAGGNGNDGGGAGGTYDSSTAPLLYGASGGSGFSSSGPSGAGGGLIRLDIDGTFTHNGTLSADGANGNVGGGLYGAGAGAGGSINISADNFTCTTGSVGADGGTGGNGTSADGGGGGGGRIAIQYQTETTSGACLLSAASDTVGGNGASVLTAGGSGPDSATDGSSGSIAVDPSVCGNSTTEAGEQCDDGGTVNGDGCDDQCRTEACGNGFVQSGNSETCDDGGTTAGDGCGATCLVEDGFNCSGEPSVCQEVSGGGGAAAIARSVAAACPLIDLSIDKLFGAVGQIKGNTTVKLGWDFTNLRTLPVIKPSPLRLQSFVKPVELVKLAKFNLSIPKIKVFQFERLAATSKRRVERLSSSAGSEVVLSIYRGLGVLKTVDRMKKIYEAPLFKDGVSEALRGYLDPINNESKTSQPYTYAIRIHNNCGRVSRTVFSEPITLPSRLRRGETVNLNVDIQLKIKDVRDGFLLNTLTDILEDHQNGEARRTDQLVAQLEGDFDQGFGAPGTENFESNALQQGTGPNVAGPVRPKVHRLIRDAIEAAFFPNGKLGADDLLIEFFENEKEFLLFMTVHHLEELGLIPLPDDVSEQSVKNQIESFVDNEVNLILQSFEGAQEAESALVNAFGNEGLLTLDPDELTSVEYVTSNENLKDTLLSIPDIENLIQGHSDTVIVEIWNPGDRNESLYEFEVQTNLFGEASFKIPDFKTGIYDFTVRREFALRKALNGVDVRTGTLPLNFVGATEEGLRFGDFNNDGKIDLDDIQTLSEDFTLNPDNFDLDEDGSFNLNDVFEVITNWGGETEVE